MSRTPARKRGEDGRLLPLEEAQPDQGPGPDNFGEGVWEAGEDFGSVGPAAFGTPEQQASIADLQAFQTEVQAEQAKAREAAEASGLRVEQLSEDVRGITSQLATLTTAITALAATTAAARTEAAAASAAAGRGAPAAAGPAPAPGPAIPAPAPEPSARAAVAEGGGSGSGAPPADGSGGSAATGGGFTPLTGPLALQSDAGSIVRSDVAPQSVIDLRSSRARSILGGAMTFV